MTKQAKNTGKAIKNGTTSTLIKLTTAKQSLTHKTPQEVKPQHIKTHPKTILPHITPTINYEISNPQMTINKVKMAGIKHIPTPKSSRYQPTKTKTKPTKRNKYTTKIQESEPKTQSTQNPSTNPRKQPRNAKLPT